MFAYSNNNPVNARDTEGTRTVENDDGTGTWYYVADNGKVFSGETHKINHPNTSSSTKATSSDATAYGASARDNAIEDSPQAAASLNEDVQVYTVKNQDAKNYGKLRKFEQGETDQFMTKGEYIANEAVGSLKITRSSAIGFATTGLINTLEYGFTKDCLISWGVDTADTLAIGMFSATMFFTVALSWAISTALTPLIDEQKKYLFNALG